jgi:peptide deformylase
MAKLTVLTVPDPKLKIKAKPVEVVDDTIRQLMDDMLETMYAEDGGGLAATQVGVALRVVVMDANAGSDSLKPNPIRMANPEIFWLSEDTCVYDEACLSVPGASGKVERPERVKFRYVDEHNVQHELEVDGYAGRCIQHEIDHLDGIVYIDHLSRLKRDLIIKRILKNRST